MSAVVLFGVSLFFIALMPIKSYAQLGDFGSIIQAADDAEILAEEYLQPFGSGFGAGINTGWTNTAPVHGVLGFSVNIRSNIAYVPEVDQMFDMAELDLHNVRLQNPGIRTTTPTLSGANDPGPGVEVFLEDEISGQDFEEVIASFDMPRGIGYRIIPTGMIQGNVGIIRDTELSLRYMPPVIPVEGMDLQLFGAGIKHELNQYVPGGGLWPVTLSVMGGFTQLGAYYNDFELHPDDYDQVDPDNDYPDSEWEDQELSLTTNAWNANLLVGKNLPIISVYGGLGMESSSMQVLTEGNYPMVQPAPTVNDPSRTEIVSEEKPIDIEFDGANQYRALAGFRLRFGLIQFSGEVTYSDYIVFNAGIGVTFR